MTTVEFTYTCTNTSSDAGLLRVLNVEQAPVVENYLAGLKFVDGVSGATEFRIAMIGGYASAALSRTILVYMDMEIYKPSGVRRDLYVQHTFLSTAATENDVSGAIDLLTVADTII